MERTLWNTAKCFIVASIFQFMTIQPALAQSPYLSPKKPAEPKLANLANLPCLEFEFPGQDGVQLTGWSIYAEPVDKENPLGPVRQVGDDDEGFSCIDDVARVALIYLQDFEKGKSPESATKAKEALKFCLNLENGEGLYYNFVEKNGEVNKTGHTSFLGFTWWTGRAFWALSQAERVLPQDDPMQADISAALDRTVERLQEYRNEPKTWPGLLATYERLGIEPGTLPDDSGSITALFCMGLTQRVRSGKADTGQAKLLEEYGEAIVKGRHAADHPFLGNLHLNSLNDLQTVHLYGNNQVQALCEAGTALQRPDFIASARAEGEHGYPQLLASWMTPFAVSPSPEPFPQIAYSAECAVSNLQALYKATGETKFSLLAGLYGTWFSGANVAGQPVYHPASGRAFDGVDPQGVSLNSGAESNAEALLAMQSLEGSPGADLLSHASTSLDQNLKILTGDDFQAEGAAIQESRTLNGGVQRPIWKLEPGSALSLEPTQEQAWLTWHGDEDAQLRSLDSHDQAQNINFDGSTHFDVDALPKGTRKLENHGDTPVWVESVVVRPDILRRTWTGDGAVTLEVTGLGTATTEDDGFLVTRTP
jgi:hypothetical protein